MRVLVTTDRSPESFRVFPHAATLAKAAGADITVLQVLDPRVDLAEEVDPVLANAAARVAERWRGELESLLRAQDYPATPHVEVKGQREDFSDTILRVADETGAVLLAMNTRGHSRLRHAFIGSVASSVVGKSRYPVMLTGAKAAEPQNAASYHIVVTNDGSPAATEVVQALRPMLEEFSPQLTLLRVYEPVLGDREPDIEMGREEAELEEVRALFPRPDDVKLHVEMVRGLEKPASALLRIAGELGATALAMSTHGHSARRHLFAGSVTMSVLGESTLPVIVARGQD